MLIWTEIGPESLHPKTDHNKPWYFIKVQIIFQIHSSSLRVANRELKKCLNMILFTKQVPQISYEKLSHNYVWSMNNYVDLSGRGFLYTDVIYFLGT